MDLKKMAKLLHKFYTTIHKMLQFLEAFLFKNHQNYCFEFFWNRYCTSVFLTFIHPHFFSMKKFFRNALLMTAFVSLMIDNVNATNIVVEHKTLFTFYPTITPAPTFVIPFVPITNAPISVKAALKEFKNTSRSERKERVKAVKAALKEYKANKKAGNEPSTNQLLMVILAIILPPLAVYLHEGEVNTKFWISLLLTLLFWLPGVIYALLVVLDEV
jgi:uncharacterized membrane protein YqaE (UPF0057 family)